MQSITVRSAAAGRAEWCRGAYDALLAEIEHDYTQGCTVHRPALPWWQARLRSERDRLYEWIIWLACDDACPLPLQERRQWLVAVLDAYEKLGVSLENVLPVALMRRFLQMSDV
jgi:hypothetical protein